MRSLHLLLLVPALVIADPSAHYKPYQDVAARQAPVVQTSTLYPPRPTTGAPQSQLRALCSSPRGRFPHPLDCRKYLDCWDGRVREVQCPNDLAYSDLSGGFCDYLEYVDCGARPVKPLPEEQVKVAHSAPQNSTPLPAMVLMDTPTTPALPTPPRGFSQHNGKYYMFSQVKADWSNARSLCQLQGAGSDLVSIETEEEHLVISARIIEFERVNPAPSVYRSANYYIGLNDQQTENNWVWPYGNKNATFRKWMINEPNGARQENCVSYGIDTTNQQQLSWFDLACTLQLRFICEWDPTILPAFAPAIENLAPPGFTKIGSDGYYLISSISAPNFDTARAICRDQGVGSDIVSLETEAEYLSVKSALIKTAGTGHYYIGLNDRAIENTWVWANGNKPATFVDWLANQTAAAAEPNDAVADCVVMYRNTGFNYVDTPCSNPNFFVCEWTPATTRNQQIDSPAEMNNVRDLSEQPETTNFPDLRSPPERIVRRRKLRRRQQIDHGF